MKQKLTAENARISSGIANGKDFIRNSIDYLLHLINEDKLEKIPAVLKITPIINMANVDGITPLYLAVLNGNVEAAKSLIENGANVNIADKNGCTVLYLSVFKRNIEMTKFLLENGANVNLANIRGEAPIYISIQLNDSKATELLLENGAEIYPTDKNGITSSSTSIELKNDKITELLLEYAKGHHYDTTVSSKPEEGSVILTITNNELPPLAGIDNQEGIAE